MSQLKKYKRIKYLGKGSYGAAILVELRSDPSKKFVIKEIVIGHLKPAEQASAKSEADVLHQMNHSNITMYVESFVESSKLYIVMEHADGGDLSGAIQKRKAESNYYAEDEVMRIFVQICLALKHVHGANILHRDLKSQNIFLTLNGMVKLGDFGIAKVLDASDDQARTQIGTPYYLSPEICESQPYGRKSDVWSLGVVLYEIIALEMPFQAQSLPALVARICNSEPNYKLVETKYSPNLIALTKSMLSKSPDKRPSLNQIVKTDFIMSHISKLLSYTLKMGNGGVVDALLKPSDLGNLSVEDADRNIEQARQRQREQERQKAAESKDAQVNSEREAKRLEEREKLRRFRQDMKNKQRENLDGASVGEDSKDSRNNRGRSPTRGASPLRGQSPRRGVAGDVSPARGRSPVNNRNGGPASPRRGNSPVRQQVNYDSPVGPSGRKQYNNAPNPVVDTSNQPRMYRQENRRDENSNRAVGPPPKIEQQPITYAPPQQQQSRNSGAGKSLAELQAERQRQMDQMRRGSNESAYRDVRNSHGGDERSVVRSSRPSDPYEDAAAREFWTNRQAAQAHKARIESDLHGGERLSIISGQPVGSKGPSGHVRRPSEHDRDQQLVGHNGAAESRRYNLYDDEKNEAENRILAIKAQKEKDRERELALKEMQLKQAIEENRDLERRRRDAQNYKGAVAFDIDLSGGDSVMTKITPPPLSNHRLAGPRRSESKESSPMAEQATRNKQSVQSVQKHQPPQPSNAVNKSVEQQRQQVIADETMCSYDSVLGDNIAPVNSSAAPSSNVSSTNTSAKQKKGWGPKVDPSEVQIAKGVARFDGVKAPSAMFDKDTALTPHSAGSRKSVGATDNDDSCSALSQLDEPGGNEAGNDSEVRKFLAKKRESQLEARNQAKGVLSRLREQRKSEAEGKKQRVVRSSVGADSKGGVVSPKKPRMMDVLSSVEMAQDAVQRAVAGNMKFLGRIQGADSKAEAEINLVLSPQNVDSAADSKTPTKQQGSPEKASGGKEEGKAPQQSKEAGKEGDNGDELNEMLQHWLQDQKRGVTTRRKAQHHHFEIEDDQAALSGLVSSDTEVEEEDGLVGHVTASARGLKEGIRRGVSPSDMDENSAGNGLSEGAGRGVYMGNDVEVVGMQCMLAKMLMGERGRDSDDDTDDEA